MRFIARLDPIDAEGRTPIAESDRFTGYAMGDQTDLLVERLRR